MARYRLTCADCGDDRTVVSRKDAKYCPSCRLLRALVYMTGKFKRARKCRTCEALFRPTGPRDLRHCGGCSAGYQSKGHVDCGFCRENAPALDHRIAVCLGCLKDPAIQPRIIAALKKGQLERRTRFQSRPHAIVRL